MLQLSQAQQELHQSAIVLCRQHRKIEARLIEVLREIDRCKLYRQLGCPSLFNYAVELLKLSESVAYAFISVARKTDKIAALRTAIEEQKLSVAKASRMVSVLTLENSVQLIEFAIQHPTRELEFEVAKINPRASVPDRAKPISESVMKLELSLSTEVYQKLQRAQNILASKISRDAGFEQTIERALTEYLERNDPVKKAERAMARKSRERSDMNMAKKLDVGSADAGADAGRTTSAYKGQSKLCAFRVRRPLTAAQRHFVSARDGGRCTHIDSTGRRCESERWLATHHIQHVSRGGSNEPKNLTTLCSHHHDLAHQLSLPLEGQVTWLRERVVRYCVDEVAKWRDSSMASSIV